MLHIIIVLGGTVFTERGHYSLVNSVREGGGGGGERQNKGGTKFTMTPVVFTACLEYFFLANIS